MSVAAFRGRSESRPATQAHPRHGWSCTAGLLSQLLSDADGAADHFHGGFVTYTKQHKIAAPRLSASSLMNARTVSFSIFQAVENIQPHEAETLRYTLASTAGCYAGSRG